MMKRLRKYLSYGVKNQILRVFFLCGVLPILVLGIFGCLTARRQMFRQYTAQISADVTRVRSILFDITTAAYQDTEKLISSRNCRNLLAAGESISSASMLYTEAQDALEDIREGAAIDSVWLYTDNPNIPAGGLITQMTAAEMAQADWYTAAAESWGRWACLTNTSRSGKRQYELCLIRRIAVVSTEYRAYMVVSIDRNYLKNRLEQTGYHIRLDVDGQPAFYATDGDGLEQTIPVPDGYAAAGGSGTFVGELRRNGQPILTAVSGIDAYRVDDRFTIALQDEAAFGDIRRATILYVLIALLAVGVPALLIWLFSRYFTRRVEALKTAMHQASMGDYDIVDHFGGDDELRDIFGDLQITVSMVRDAEARYYQSLLNEQQLVNRQQQMEFKMLSSQINPHFLYNTLEMIRMQALAAGAREVAQSIKLLGKSMHYVLETTGTQFTTLDRELDYVKTYLTIQQLRFGDRVDFAFRLPEGFDASLYQILPLLLQPVVENAVTHGLRDSTAKGLVTIELAAVGESLLLSVADNGRGMPPEEAAKVQAELASPHPEGASGIALCNIHQRIRLVYGSRYGVRLQTAVGRGTRVEIELPLHFDGKKAGGTNVEQAK